MRDGIHLAATVYRPASKGQFPVIMCVTAYGKDFGPAEYSTLPKLLAAGMSVGTMHISDVTTWEGPDPGFWVPNGYVVVVANARGFYDSEGTADIYSETDAHDYADLIEWAGVQKWSTGAVGLNGVSYLAITQWMVASRTKPAHLKAIVPWEGVTDNYRDAAAHGGIPETRFLHAWFAGSLARGAGDEIVARAPEITAALKNNPFPLENIDVPTLVCASWSDHGLHNRGSIEGFTRISSVDKWLYTHGRDKWDVYYSADALEWQKAFLDHFLKGEKNGFEQRPPVRLEIRRSRTEFDIRGEASWPPASVKFERRYLDLARKTMSEAAPVEPQTASYDAESKDPIAFDLVFERRTELTGPAALKLWISTSQGDDLDLFVALRKIDAEGREVNFCGKDGSPNGLVSVGWLRVSQRHLDEGRSKPWRPFLSHSRDEKVRPGEIVPVEIELLSSSTLFEAGETLRLVISGRDIMEHARFGHDDTVNRGAHTLHVGQDRQAHLLLPFC